MAFIGSTGSFTINQRQIDIESEAGIHGPLRRRLVHHCIGHSLAFMYTEVQVDGIWVTSPAAGFIAIHSRGPSTSPPLPPPGIPIQPILLFIAGLGLSLPRFPLPFCQRLFITHSPPAPPPPIFRYIPHSRADPNADMVPDSTRQPVSFAALECGGHVQNWRNGHN